MLGGGGNPYGVGLLPNKIDGMPGAQVVAAGDPFSCAIADGNVYCWGEGDLIESLGGGFDDPVPIPGLPTR